MRSFYKTRIPEQLKQKKLKDIKTQDLQRVANDMVDAGYSGRYIKSLQEVFGPMLDKASLNGIIDLNPLVGVTFPSFDNKRKFYLSDDKIKALYQRIMDIPHNDYRLIFMLLMRGRRMNEVLSLDWKDIDLEAKQYTIRAENYKGRRSMYFLIDTDLEKHLKHYAEQTPERHGFVFKSRVNGKRMEYIPRRLWQRIKSEVDIEDMTPHDFRHIVGFTLINNNVPIEIISKTLGHAQIATTQRYSRMKEEMAQKGLDAFLGIIKG